MFTKYGMSTLTPPDLSKNEPGKLPPVTSVNQTDTNSKSPATTSSSQVVSPKQKVVVTLVSDSTCLKLREVSTSITSPKSTLDTK
jgi:hypothetical protein